MSQTVADVLSQILGISPAAAGGMAPPGPPSPDVWADTMRAVGPPPMSPKGSIQRLDAQGAQPTGEDRPLPGAIHVPKPDVQSPEMWEDSSPVVAALRKALSSAAGTGNDLLPQQTAASAPTFATAPSGGRMPVTGALQEALDLTGPGKQAAMPAAMKPGFGTTTVTPAAPSPAAPDPDAIMRAASLAHMQSRPNGQSTGTGGPPPMTPMQAFSKILLQTLEGAARVDPRSPGASAFAQGAAGALGAKRSAEDRALKRQLAQQAAGRQQRAETRAERADTRAEGAAKRADEIHRLNVKKLTEEIKRRTGQNLTPEQMIKLDQIARGLFTSSRAGASMPADPEDVEEAYRQFRDLVQAPYRPLTWPSNPNKGSTQTLDGRPAARTGGAAQSRGAAPGAGVPVGGTYTSKDGKVYRRVGPGNTQQDWQEVQ